MDNRKDDSYYIEKVIANIDIINSYLTDKTYDQFLLDTLLIDAVMFRLVQMVENINHISLGFKERHPSIPWGKIAGFRNGIVHEYGKTDYRIVYEIISKDLLFLKTELLNNNA